MRYTIEGFSQRELVEHRMDAADAVILRWLVDFSATGKMRMRLMPYSEGAAPPGTDRAASIPHYWIHYETVLSELPILGITAKDVIARRLKRMAKEGILSHQTVREEGTFSYYGFGATYINLIEMGDPTQKSDPSDPKVGPPPTFESDPLRPESRSKDSFLREIPLQDNAIGAASAPDSPPVPKRKKGNRITVRSPEDNALLKQIGDAMTERGGHWVSGVKEAKALERLLAWAKRSDTAHYGDLLKHAVRTLWRLHEGMLPNMTAKDKEWWSRRAFTPSSLEGLLHLVMEWARPAKAAVNKVDSEAVAAAVRGDAP
jgi:hypothetical protein